ncbi:cell envelope biogenesis protein AsmA [Marinobacterium zhoushanense]|uniref:Cell envelope biogenesis protein AsmA n=1 Tax=Marinobacterium zhoushanense TaxID=1679163 RepID=A0ABQ1KWN0_9GAMM|nr:AsmA family protein [Marinobacterium zhoushanense]GGC10192.1 cell envelope biogenesis protein AsmA [Marinobacterium zhoushanense]
MKLLTRLLIGILVFVLLLIGAGGVILGFVIDPNDYRSEIEQAALESGGVELKINGEIDWSVFPWLGLAVNDIAIRYPEQPQLATLNQAQLSVKLMPLFSGNVEMSSILVDGLKLNLITTGRANNWTGTQADKGTAAMGEEQQDRGRSGGALRGLDIESITLSNAQLRYVDEAAGSRIEVNQLNLTTGRIAPEQEIPIELSAQMNQFQGDTQTLAMTTTLSTNAQLNLEAKQYQLSGLNAEVEVNSAALGPQPLKLGLKGQVDADIAAQRVDIELQQLALANLIATGQVGIETFATPTFSGELNLAKFDLKQLLTQLGQSAPETSDAKALTAVGLNAKLAGPANTLTLNPLTLTLDDTTFTGSLTIDLKSQAQTIALKGDSLNADRYLPPASNEKAGQQSASNGQSGGERWSKEEVIPVEPLKALNLDAKLDLAQLKISGLDANNLGLTVSAHNGLVKISRIDADLYSGTLRNAVTLDARKSPLQIAIDKKITGVQIGELLTAMNGSAPITGAVSSTAKLSAQGQSIYAIVNSLSGNASVNAADGVIEGINMAQTICQGINNVASLGINTEQVDQSTPFANMGGNFNISNGVVSNKDLAATLDAMSLAGRGSVDLPKALVDYRLGLTIKENLFKQTCSVNNRLEGVEFPVNCKGSFDTPPAKMCSPDASVFANLLKAEAKKKVEEKVSKKIEEKLGEKLGDEGAKSLLKGLFGN